LPARRTFVVGADATSGEDRRMHKVLCSTLILIPFAAAAQVPCADGKVSNEDTRGNCCWPGQAWSVTRSVCVGTPQCPAGYVAGDSACVRTGPVVTPGPTVVPPAPPAAPGISLGSEERIMKHMQLSQQLVDLRRQADDKHWITDYIVGGAVGIGLITLGYVLNVIFLGVLPADAAGYAAFWTFFGCALGGSITFLVLSITGTVKLIQWIALRAQATAKEDELKQFDDANHIQAPAPSSLWSAPQPAFVLSRF
jgi:hypothetical protein